MINPSYAKYFGQLAYKLILLESRRIQIIFLIVYLVLLYNLALSSAILMTGTKKENKLELKDIDVNVLVTDQGLDPVITCDESS